MPVKCTNNALLLCCKLDTNYCMPLRLLLTIACLWLALAAHTQLCSGPAADPVAVIDFGTEAMPYTVTGKLGSPYQPAAEACTPRGTLALRARAFMCKPEWQVTPFDHTVGDRDGLFLMVSALPGNSVLFRDTVRGLCPETVYNFEMWITNLLVASACEGQGRDPNLRVEVVDERGVVLATAASGTLAETIRSEWVAHRFQFRSPPSGFIAFNITSLNGASCGSDFGIDDISLSPCKAGIQAALLPSGGTALQVCQDQQQPLRVGASYSGFRNATLQWQYSEGGSNFFDLPGATGATLERSPLDAGSYAYRLKLTENGIAACAFTSNAVQVVVHRKPFAQSTSYLFGCYGFPASFQAAGGSRFEWEGPAGFRSTEAAPRIDRLDFSHAGRYRVKVTSTNGCVAYDSTDLVVYTAPTATLRFADTAICTGGSVQLAAGGAPRFLWQPSDGLSNDTVATPTARPLKTTRYTVRVYNAFTCYDTASVLVQVLPRPTADAGPDQFVLKNRPVQLSGRAGGAGVQLRWSPATLLDDPRAARPRTRLQQTTVFRLEADLRNGCGIATDEVKIEVIDQLLIPTAFTPNGDQLNDIWEIVALADYPNAVVRVFNRWGQQVYSSTGRNYRPWNGTSNGVAVTPGLYIYQLELGNGTPVRKGTLAVLK